MKICFIADANSIHARRWMEYFLKPENEVFILSTTRNPKPLGDAVVYDLSSGKPVAPSAENTTAQKDRSPLSMLKRFMSNIIRSSPGLTRFVEKYLLLYYTLRQTGKARLLVERIKPDLLHCLRLPIEGYIGALTGYRPLVISSWGNDFIFFARKYYLFRRLTKKAMNQADAYIPDTARDKDIAVLYGFSPDRPTLVSPVTGGLKLKDYPSYRQPRDRRIKERIGVNPDTNLLVMTRDFKSHYANTPALIEAMPQIIKVFPDTLLVMVGDINSPAYHQLKRRTERLDIKRYVRFSHWLAYDDFVNHLSASDVFVSVGIYDGCPLSMLECMVCGTIPVMSNDPAIQEWITDGWNGYLFNPRDPESIAQAVIRALNNKANFEVIRKRNWDILSERADYNKNMKVAEELLSRLVKHTPTQ